jgi:hypothetical protein
VNIKISILGENSLEALQAVHDWLVDDRDIRTKAEIKVVEARSGDGSMAADIGLISLVVSSGFNIASLGVAIAGWRATRAAPPPMRIEAKGVEVTIDGSEPGTAEKIAKAFSKVQEDDEMEDNE